MIKLILGILVLCSFGISGAATAGEDSGVYVYGAAGQSQLLSQSDSESLKTSLDAALTTAGMTGLSSSTDDNQDTYLFFIGYQFNSKWAIEGGYAQLGTVSYSAQGAIVGLPASASASIKTSAASISAVRTWNVPDHFGNNAFSFLAKFGIAQVKSSASESASVTIPTFISVVSYQSYTKKGVTFGLGAKYDFDQNWALRLDADSFDTGQYAYGRVPVYSLGLSYKY